MVPRPGPWSIGFGAVGHGPLVLGPVQWAVVHWDLGPLVGPLCTGPGLAFRSAPGRRFEARFMCYERYATP